MEWLQCHELFLQPNTLESALLCSSDPRLNNRVFLIPVPCKKKKKEKKKKKKKKKKKVNLASERYTTEFLYI